MMTGTLNLRWYFAFWLLLVFFSTRSTSFAQGTGQKKFATAGEAGRALYEAVNNNDDQTLTAVLGGEKDIVSSGDESRDKLERERFTEKYRQMHRLVHEADGSVYLYIGAENWPFPLPLISKNGTWFFDTEAGKDEIAYRAIGENENTVFDICRSLGSGHVPEASVNTAIVASVDSVRNSSDPRTGPLFGYYFRRLNSEPSGSVGLRYIAYPVDYASTGVMTFVVTLNGEVYERDFGTDTAAAAKSLTKWKPSASWRKLENTSLNP